MLVVLIMKLILLSAFLIINFTPIIKSAIGIKNEVLPKSSIKYPDTKAPVLPSILFIDELVISPNKDVSPMSILIRARSNVPAVIIDIKPIMS